MTIEPACELAEVFTRKPPLQNGSVQDYINIPN